MPSIKALLFAVTLCSTYASARPAERTSENPGGCDKITNQIRKAQTVSPEDGRALSVWDNGDGQGGKGVTFTPEYNIQTQFSNDNNVGNGEEILKANPDAVKQYGAIANSKTKSFTSSELPSNSNCPSGCSCAFDAIPKMVLLVGEGVEHQPVPSTSDGTPCNEQSASYSVKFPITQGGQPQVEFRQCSKQGECGGLPACASQPPYEAPGAANDLGPVAPPPGGTGEGPVAPPPYPGGFAK